MRGFLWLSLIPLTAFWLISLDIYGPAQGPVQLMAAASILLGVILSVVGLWREEAVIDRRYAVVLVPLALASLVIPYPYNVGLIICALALIVSLAVPDLKSAWLGTLFAGSVLALDALALGAYYIFAPSHHDATLLTAPLTYLLRLSGLDTASNQGAVLIHSKDGIFPFTVTLEKLGFYPWILIFAGAMVLILLTSKGLPKVSERLSGAIGISFIYLLLRYVLLAHVFISTDMPEFAMERMWIFTDPWWLMASFAPLVLLFLWLYPEKDSNLDDGRREKGDTGFDLKLEIDRTVAVALLAVMVSIFCLTSAVIFQDPGTKKDGRILVDEIHSLWESSILKLDKNWYGEGSTYNAYSMVEWLKDSYKVDRIVSSSFKEFSVSGASKVVPDLVSDNLTYDILKNYDILIIKTPSQYSPEEIDAIVHFVENGGGLFLIGDHTNFGGTGANLNQISRRFGIEFGFDSVNAINNTLYYHNRGLLPHPVAKYMPRLDFMTGCSLMTSINVEPVILGFGMISEPGEYSSVGFFRETRNNDPTRVTDTTWGLINQAVALQYGKGRVVAFSDSTIISNFRFFFGGSPNLVVGAVEYLNFQNSRPGVKMALFFLGALMAAIAVFLLGRMSLGDRKMAVLILMIALGAVAASGALFTFSTKTEETIPSQFYAKDRTISFDGDHSDLITSTGNRMGQYETFFIWTQRINLTPVMAGSLREAMEKGKAVVVIDPVKPLTYEEQSSLLKYIQDGHSILVVMNSEGPWSSPLKDFGFETYQISQPANVSWGYAPGNNSAWSGKDGLPIAPWGLSIEGGKALLREGPRVVLAEAKVGNGSVLLFTDSHAFMDGLYGKPGYMGYSKVDLRAVDRKDYDLKALYDLEYNIVENQLGFKKGEGYRS